MITMRVQYKAVLRAELEAYLDHLGIKSDVQSGTAICSNCGAKLTIESIGRICNRDGALELICMSDQCRLSSGQDSRQLGDGG